MIKPKLVVMAAGLGSRFGGIKQMEAVCDNGEWLIDFSLYDAFQAGFEDVVFIVRQEILEDFKDTIGKRVAGKLNVQYAVQQLDDLPEGFSVPEGRVKPWGTGHAVYSAREEIGNAPFMAINADDYYGPQAFKGIFDHLSNTANGDNYNYVMAGYILANTVTENGHVSRGVCSVDSSGYLKEIHERTHICQRENGIFYTEDAGESWVELPEDSPVSLNCWGFHSSMLDEMEADFASFLKEAKKTNPQQAEYYLPTAVETLIENGKAKVKVFSSHDKWYGVTYKEDKDKVCHALVNMKKQGKYPQNLWD